MFIICSLSQLHLKFITKLYIHMFSKIVIFYGCYQKFKKKILSLQKYLELHKLWYVVCLKSIQWFWIGQEPFVQPWCKLATNQRGPSHTHTQSLFSQVLQLAVRCHWVSMCIVWPLNSQWICIKFCLRFWQLFHINYLDIYESSA